MFLRNCDASAALTYIMFVSGYIRFMRSATAFDDCLVSTSCLLMKPESSSSVKPPVLVSLSYFFLLMNPPSRSCFQKPCCLCCISVESISLLLRDFSSMKLYLYYTQMGRCMYTGEPIDLDALMSGNSKWDRDHIYPQSRIKDDSIDNLVLVNKAVNSRKSNEMLSTEIQQRQHGFWKQLLEGGFISKKKYDRLTRTGGFTEEELSGFISRQLVETRQSSKAVADLMKRIYPDTNIIYVKAALASQFRRNNIHMLKSRRVQ